MFSFHVKLQFQSFSFQFHNCHTSVIMDNNNNSNYHKNSKSTKMSQFIVSGEYVADLGIVDGGHSLVQQPRLCHLDNQ